LDNPSKDIRIDPPKNTVAIVVDVRGGQGAIHIIKTQDNKHVDKVGPVKEGGNLVMVPGKIYGGTTLLVLSAWHISQRSLE
jgi:hypothetical protein